MEDAKTERSPNKITAVLFVAILAIFITIIWLTNSNSVSNATDSYSYLQLARTISEHGLFSTSLHDPLIPKLSKFFPDEKDRDLLCLFLAPWAYYVYDFEKGLLYNNHLPGFPFLISIFSKIVSPFYIVPILSLIFILAISWYFKKNFGEIFALLFTSSLLFTYQFLANAIKLLSDIPSLSFLSSSLLILNEGLLKRSFLMLISSGVLFGYSIGIRYPNAIMILIVIYLFIIRFETYKPKRVLLIVSFIMGLLFIIVPLLIYQYKLFGQFLKPTYVYRSAPLSYLFSVSYFFYNFGSYLLSLPKAIGIIGMIIILIGVVHSFRKNHKKNIVEISLMLAILCIVFFSFYKCIDTRYLLPLFFSSSIFFAFGGEYIFKFLKRKNILLSYITIILLTFYPLVNCSDYFFEKRSYFNKFWMVICSPSLQKDEAYHAFGKEISSAKKSLFKKYAKILLEKGLSAKIDIGIRDVDILCNEIKSNVEDNAIIFCNGLSGPLRLYTNIRTYKFSSAYDKYFMKLTKYMHQNGFPIYIYIDDKDSLYTKEELSYLDYLKKSAKFNIYNVGKISRGMLLRIVPY